MGAGSKDPLTIMTPAGKDYKDIATTAADAQVLMQGYFCSLRSRQNFSASGPCGR